MAYSIATDIGDGVTTDFSVTFDYLDRSHVVVRVDKVKTTDLAATHQFTWVNSTTVRVTTFPGGLAPAVGAVVDVIRVTPINTPAVVFGGGAALSSENLNKNSEYLTYALQEATDVSQSFTKLYLGSFDEAPVSDNEGEALQIGAVYYDSLASALFYWTGTIWIIGESTVAAETFKLAAEAAAAAALASQGAAASSQSAAAGSASAASTSASNASASAVAAASSETAAGLSASASAASQSAAAGSASTASTQAVNASTSASAASGSAGAAATSASNASTSEGTAALSASGASGSAVSASGSASAASTSETNAALSETNAAASAAEAAISAAIVNPADYATAAQGALADTALQSVPTSANADFAVDPSSVASRSTIDTFVRGFGIGDLGGVLLSQAVGSELQYLTEYPFVGLGVGVLPLASAAYNGTWPTVDFETLVTATWVSAGIITITARAQGTFRFTARLLATTIGTDSDTHGRLLKNAVEVQAWDTNGTSSSVDVSLDIAAVAGDTFEWQIKAGQAPRRGLIRNIVIGVDDSLTTIGLPIKASEVV